MSFVAGAANERGPILDLVRRAAAESRPGSRLLDVGAGDSPYRELFKHLHYQTTDWEHSIHDGARTVDYVCSAHQVPVEDAQFDAALCTQMLEHVPNPQEVLDEIFRILKPGGRLYMTLPLVWGLHEMPHDFFRYTASGTESLLRKAGFTELDIRARTDSFRTFAQMFRILPELIGRYPDGRDPLRSQVATEFAALADRLDSLSELDSRWLLPLGYSVTATRPALETDDAALKSAAHRAEARSACGLKDARSLVTLCFASDVIAEPRMLSDYAQHFGADDDATLVIYAPMVDVREATKVLAELVRETGLDGLTAPAMIGLPVAGRAREEHLRAAVDAVFALRPPWGAFAGCHWINHENLAELRASLELTSGA